MRSFLWLSVAIIAIQSGESHLKFHYGEWLNYKIEHEKFYENPFEDFQRNQIWLKNRQNIAQHNQLYEDGKVSYEMSLNQFSDMEFDEIEQFYLSPFEMPDEEASYKKYVVYEPVGGVNLSEQINWAEKGAVTPVKNQGRCGSCYAFSSTGAIEGQNFLVNNKLTPLSEQQLVDCTKNYGNNGCHGGLMHKCFEYIMAKNGIETEGAYPYNGNDRAQCHASQTNIGAHVKKFEYIQPSEDAVLKTLTARGPIATAITVKSTFMGYRSGVYNDPSCTSRGINHAVLIVGYGSENGLDYWIIKNSWVCI